MSKFHCTLLVSLPLLLCAALVGCGHNSGRLGEFGTVDDANCQGHVEPVSDDFQIEHARELQTRLGSDRFHKALEEFSCGQPVPDFKFGVVMYERVPYGSRRVQIYYSPKIGIVGHTRCLSFGMDYLLEKATAEIDPTKQFSHQYDGARSFEAKNDRVTRKPHCDCDQTDPNKESVTFPGPDEEAWAPFLAPGAIP